MEVLFAEQDQPLENIPYWLCLGQRNSGIEPNRIDLLRV